MTAGHTEARASERAECNRVGGCRDSYYRRRRCHRGCDTVTTKWAQDRRDRHFLTVGVRLDRRVDHVPLLAVRAEHVGRDRRRVAVRDLALNEAMVYNVKISTLVDKEEWVLKDPKKDRK